MWVEGCCLWSIGLQAVPRGHSSLQHVVGLSASCCMALQYTINNYDAVVRTMTDETKGIVLWATLAAHSGRACHRLLKVQLFRDTGYKSLRPVLLLLLNPGLRL